VFGELPFAEIGHIEPLFSLPQMSLVLRAVLQGNSPARVWVDLPVAPRVALVWDLRHCIYLTGDVHRATSSGLLRSVFTEIAAEAKAAEIHLFKVYLVDSSWEAAIQDILPTLRRRDRVLFKVGPDHVPEPVRPPDGFRLVLIDQGLLNDRGLKNLELVREEIGGGWPSVARFLEHGFGIVVRHDDALVAWCTAEYVSDGKCGIGIETMPAFRARGLATLAATAFVTECAARGLATHWDSWRDNRPSLRVAEKVGFQPLNDYHVYFGQEIGPEE
jgi:GNAT superfamily N-acetyltransferase